MPEKQVAIAYFFAECGRHISSRASKMAKPRNLFFFFFERWEIWEAGLPVVYPWRWPFQLPYKVVLQLKVYIQVVVQLLFQF